MSTSIPRGGWTADEFCERWSISRPTFYREIANGNLNTIKIGNKRIITLKNEQDWLDKKQARA